MDTGTLTLDRPGTMLNLSDFVILVLERHAFYSDRDGESSPHPPTERPIFSELLSLVDCSTDRMWVRLFYCFIVVISQW